MPASYSRNNKPHTQNDKSADAQINQRLNEHIRANAINLPSAARGEAAAVEHGAVTRAIVIIAILGLMVISSIYSAIFDRSERH